MDNEVDERIPRGGGTLVTVFAVPGVVFGLLAYLAFELLDDVVSSTEAAGQAFLGIELTYPAALALAYGLVFGFGTYFLTVLRGQVAASAIAAGVIGVVTATLTFIAPFNQSPDGAAGLISFLANGVLVTVALPFLRARSRGVALNHYPTLYADAWNIPVIVGVAQLFVLAGVALAALVAALFVFVGLPFLRDLMEQGWFIGSYLGLLQGVGIGVTRQRESAILAARGIKMALLRVAAPVFAVSITIFVVAVMIRGFGSLLGDLSPMSVLTMSAIVAIIMINSIVADKGRPESALFGATARLLGVVLLFLMCLAIYGLYMRVAAEGWTPNRVHAAILVAVVGLYAPIYAAAALSEQWAILRQGNIAVSALLMLIAVLVQTPVYAPQDWSAVSQLEQITRDPAATTGADIRYLRDRLGPVGARVVEQLEANPPDGLEDPYALAELGRGTPEDAMHLTLETLRDNGIFTVFPVDAEIEDALAKRLEHRLGRSIDDPNDAAVVFDQDHASGYFFVRRAASLQAYRLISDEDGEWTVTYLRQFYGEDRVGRMLAGAAEGALSYEQRTFVLPSIGGDALIEPAAELNLFRVESEPLPPPLEAADVAPVPRGEADAAQVDGGGGF
ncbi:MAG: hypothetical protein AAF608_00305 [Pseudomonadota bacterium]